MWKKDWKEEEEEREERVEREEQEGKNSGKNGNWIMMWENRTRKRINQQRKEGEKERMKTVIAREGKKEKVSKRKKDVGKK